MDFQNVDSSPASRDWKEGAFVYRPTLYQFKSGCFFQFSQGLDIPSSTNCVLVMNFVKTIRYGFDLIQDKFG